MKKHAPLLFAVVLFLACYFTGVQAGIIPAIIPAAVPTASITASPASKTSALFVAADSSENVAVNGSLTSGNGGSTIGALDLKDPTNGGIGTLTWPGGAANKTWTLPAVTGTLPLISGTPTGGNCAQWVTANTIGQAAAACGSGGGSGSSVANATPVTVSANTTSDQSLMELSLTAGYLNTSLQNFAIGAAGVYTTALAQTPTMTFKAKLCTVSGCGSGTVVTLVSIATTATTAAATNNQWNLLLNNVITKTTGASGNLEVHGVLTVDLGANNLTADAVFADTNTAVSSNIDLTAALFIDFTVATSTGSASNSITQRGGYISPFVASSGGGAAPNGFYLSSSGSFYIGPTFQLATLPVAGNFAWVNQGGATETASGNALVLVAPAGAGDSLRVRQQSISTNTTLTVSMSCTAQIEDHGACGIGFRESGTGKLLTLANNLASTTGNCTPSSSTPGCLGATLQVARWNSATSFNNTQYLENYGPWITQWAQINISGGNLSLRISNDGVNFVQLYTEASNAFFTTAPDQWFYFANANNTTLTQSVTATLFSFKMQ